MQRVATPIAEWDAVVDVYAELGVAWVVWDGAAEPVHPRLRFVGEEHGFRLYRIEGAKRAETRARRIAQFVAMLARGDTIYPQRRTLER